jgi:hypothetical protein
MLDLFIFGQSDIERLLVMEAPGSLRGELE